MAMCTPEYLRELADDPFRRAGAPARDALRDAADEIERLRRERNEARAGLKQYLEAVAREDAAITDEQCAFPEQK